MRATLPDDRKARKQIPIGTGVLDYFPDAIAAVAYVSFLGNEQHNPGEPLHWARGKSDDHEDTMQRHYLQRGTPDTDGALHSAKMVWRALAILQLEIEASRKAAAQAPAAAAATARQRRQRGRASASRSQSVPQRRVDRR